MSDQLRMPPPPPLRSTLERAAAAAAAAGEPLHLCSTAHQQALPDRDPELPLPLPTAQYFDAVQQVHCPERGTTFNVYTAGASGPVLLCLHGGGYTGLSWALMARKLKDRCRVVSPDLRAHGLTQTADDGDLSAATLAADVVALWQQMFSSSGCDSGGIGAQSLPEEQGQGQGSPAADPPATVLVGHSMGGAVAVHAAALAGIPSLAGIVVIDVVEGTAIASLPFMSAVLQKRPKHFASLQQAVDWALDTGMCKRQEAAHISLPAMLRPAGSDGSTAAADPALCFGMGGLEPLAEGAEEDEAEAAAGSPAAIAACAGQDTDAAAAARDPQQQPHNAVPPPAHASGTAGGWVWRTHLEQSAPFWEGWYSGLSDLFLKLSVPKVLVLVGTDRLDRPLTIGQMQGKFQPVLLPQSGHAIQEDEPGAVADAIATFVKRFRIGEPPLRIPRPAGVRPVLPVAMGPAFLPQQPPQHS